jgi:hypothetical protein
LPHRYAFRIHAALSDSKHPGGRENRTVELNTPRIATERLVQDAKGKGEVRASLNARATARHLNATIIGLKVMSKSGASAEALRDVAVAALDGMAPQRPGRNTGTKR